MAAASGAAAPPTGENNNPPNDEDVDMQNGEEAGEGRIFEVKKWMPIAMWSWNIQQVRNTSFFAVLPLLNFERRQKFLLYYTLFHWVIYYVLPAG